MNEIICFQVAPRVDTPTSPTTKEDMVHQNLSETATHSTPASPIIDKNKQMKNGVSNIADIEITTANSEIVWSGTDEAPSPVQAPSSASSGFSDDDSLHGEPSGFQSFTMEQLVADLKARGRAGLVAEYAEIRQRPPDGSFNNAKCVIVIFLYLCENVPPPLSSSSELILLYCLF